MIWLKFLLIIFLKYIHSIHTYCILIILYWYMFILYLLLYFPIMKMLFKILVLLFFLFCYRSCVCFSCLCWFCFALFNFIYNSRVSYPSYWLITPSIFCLLWAVFDLWFQKFLHQPMFVGVCVLQWWQWPVW
jgi:hypothetical protein